jgi:hypothetical protein
MAYQDVFTINIILAWLETINILKNHTKFLHKTIYCYLDSYSSTS